MLEESLAVRPRATWNSEMEVWTTTQTNLLSERLALWQEAWPTSGMIVDGSLFELPISERRTGESVSSSLPIPEESMLRTPSVTDSTGGAISEKQARERGRMVKTADQAAELAFNNGLPVSESIAASLMPTPLARDWKESSAPVYRDGVIQVDTVPRVIFNSGEIDLLPTPQAHDGPRGMNSSPEHREAQGKQVMLSNHAPQLRFNWGKFEPAIRRWEAVLGRPAPAPTRPDGRGGAHRLSPEFTEWMMGLKPGHITGAGVGRKEEIKAAGNGVVPQQAQYALGILLEGLEW